VYKLKNKTGYRNLCKLVSLGWMDGFYYRPRIDHEILEKYNNRKEFVWAQEEPENMGAWQYMAMRMRGKDLIGVTRPAAAAAAEGSKELHLKRLNALWNNLFQYAAVKA